MANSYFQFKQFKINQGDSAMKVGTDGVLLGAWTEVNAAEQKPSPRPVIYTRGRPSSATGKRSILHWPGGRI